MEPNSVNQPVPQVPQNSQLSTLKVFIAVLSAFILGGAVVYLWQNPQFLNSLPFLPQPKSCTMEAKICPDGSSVGRTGANCEFAPCPSANSSAQPFISPLPENATPRAESDLNSFSVPADWKTYINKQDGFTFKYPPEWWHALNPQSQYDGFFLVGTDPDFVAVGKPGSNEILAVGGIHRSSRTFKEAKEEIGTDTRFEFFNIDGRPAMKSFSGKFPTEKLSQITIWVVDNQIVPIVLFNSGRAEPYIDQILSTFKFTN